MRVKKYYYIFLAIHSLILFGLVNYLAFNNAFSHDESYGFLHTLYQEFNTILLLSWKDANNHPLNTWFMYISSLFFGNGEYALRVPNVLSFVLYLISLFFIVISIKSKKVSYLCFLLLTTNPLIIQFFTQARGYGIGTGLELFSLLIGIIAFKSNSKINRLFLSQASILFAMLSTFANYTFLHFYFALSSSFIILYIFELQKIYKSDKSTFKTDLSYLSALIISIISSAICIALFVGREVFTLSILKKLYYGGHQNFWTDTVHSLINSSFPSLSWVFPMLEIIVALSLFYIFLRFLYLFKNKNILEKSYILFPLSIFFIISLTTSLGHYIFDFRYLLERTAIFIIPLLIISLAYLIDEHINKSQKLKSNLPSNILSVLIVIFLIHFALIIKNNNYSDKNTLSIKKTLSLIDDNRDKASDPDNVKLGISWHFEPILNYYRIRNNLSWLAPLTRYGVNGDYDFYYYFTYEKDQLENKEIKILNSFDNNTSLATNK